MCKFKKNVLCRVIFYVKKKKMYEFALVINWLLLYCITLCSVSHGYTALLCAVLVLLVKVTLHYPVLC